MLPQLSYLDTLGTILHVYPVIHMVPHTLYTQVARAFTGVGQTSEGLNEEALWYLTLAR